MLLNFLQNNKFLELFNFKAFSDDIIFVTEDFKFVLGILENTVGKGENAGYQNAVFKRPILLGCEKEGLFVEGLIG